MNLRIRFDEGEVAIGKALRKYAQVFGAEREALKADLKRRYLDGESIRALSISTGRSYGFVHRLLQESDVELRPRGGNQRPARAAA